MKKFLYILPCVAGLVLASCANEELTSPPSGEGLQITINLPDNIGTRDASSQMQLNYAVYDSNNGLVDTGFVTFTGSSTTFNTNLISGRSYTLAFFAQNAGYLSAYTFSAENQSVTANYSEMNSADAYNSGGYDCFYNTYAYTPQSSSSSVSVTLNRPIAQINWGTNDLTGKVQETFSSVYSTLSTEAYSQFSLLDGSLTGDKARVTIGAYLAPTISYPQVNASNTVYNYVGMQYLLAGKTSAVYDLNLNISNNDGTSPGETVDVVVTAAPLQANYRTNIYGSLLTDNVSLNINLGEWGGQILEPQEMGEEIDGTGLYYNQATKTYSITSVPALQKMASLSQDMSLQNYRMVLTTDLDMADVNDYTPIKNSLGVFDGQGHKISNFTLNGSTYVGFFSQGLGTIQNITFENANVSGNHYVAIVAGYGANAQFNNINIIGGSVTATPMENETGGTYKYGDKAGAITGYLSAEDGTAYVTNCNVSGFSITGYTMIGSVVGYANFASDYAATSKCYMDNNTAVDCNVTANQKFNGTYQTSDVDFAAGEIYGYAAPGVTYSNNTATNVSITTISSTGETTNYVPSAEAWNSLINGKYTWANNVVLTGDLDFKGGNVTGTRFMGTFDGQGHTIKNGNIIAKSDYATGFFAGDIGSGTLTVNDVTFENMISANPTTAYGWAAVVIGDIQTFNVVLNNVNVIDSKISGVYCLGSLVGFVAGNRSVTINNCQVEGCTLENISLANESGFVCGMVGRVVGSATFGEGNIVEDVTINAYYAEKRGENSIAAVAAPNSTSSVITGLEDVEVKNVNITKTPID